VVREHPGRQEPAHAAAEHQYAVCDDVSHRGHPFRAMGMRYDFVPLPSRSVIVFRIF
jgi:hypothetical protein